MRPPLPHLLSLLALSFTPALAQELPEGLPDFSRVGYREGQVPKVLAPTLDVRTFGAKGDGVSDDTLAFQRAIAQASKAGGVVAIPQGRWVIKGVLEIRASGVVLQGAGADKTVLVCPNSLSELKGPSRRWSHSGGMIDVAPAKGPTHAVAEVSGGAGRLLKVRWTQAKRPTVGEWLELRWFNDRGADTLLDHLYGGVIKRKRMGKELQESEAARVVEWVRVARVTDEAVAVERLVTLPLREAWRPQLFRRPSLREVGIEGIGFAFPKTTYPGHLLERGYNAIMIRCAIDSWVRDVATLNADSGVIVNRSRRVTVSDVVIRGRFMHHCLSTSWSSHCLITRWRIEAPHRHGTTISWGAHRNVYSQGWGNALAMDSHRAASFENLHSQITIDWGGRTQSPLRSGGSLPRGPHAARDNVYWNVVYKRPSPGPIKVWGHNEWPRGVFVGWRSERPLTFTAVRGLEQRILFLNRPAPVPDLHAEQLRVLRRTRRWF